MLLYTDKYREWIANPLIDGLMDMDVKLSVAFTENFENDDIDDVIRSLQFLNENTLIISLLSILNQNISRLSKILSFDNTFFQYSGLSINISPQLIDTHFYEFINFDPDIAVFRRNRINKIENLRIQCGEHILDVIIEDFEVTESGHLLLPDTKLLFESIDLNGEFLVNGSISPYIRNGETLDYFGPVSDEFVIVIEDSYCAEFICDTTSSSLERLEKIEDLDIIAISIGIGHNRYHPPGIPLIDQYLGGSVSLHLSNGVQIISYDCTIESQK